MKVIPYEPAWEARVLAQRAQAGDPGGWGPLPAHWRWRFLGHPSGLPPVAWLAVEGERLLGQWSGMRDTLHAAGRDWPCAWMVDLYVDPAARDTMAALALFRAATQSRLTLLAIGASPAVTGFFSVFRWSRLAVADTFFRVFRPGPLLALAERAAPGALAAGLPLLDATLPRAWRLRPAPRAPRVQAVDRLGPEVDALYAALAPRLGVSSRRDAEVLRWRLDERPCGRHQAFVIRGPGDALRGYAVLKLRRRAGVACWGELADLLVDPEDGEGFLALVEACSAAALDLDLDFLRVRCALPAHTTTLRPPTWRREVRVPMDDLFAWGGGDPAAHAAITGHPWALTALCADQVDSGVDEWEGPPPAG